ncbi:hypothetical protein [Planococcus antarcticus]|uniref:Lipoprotein n=1 Tax=Planococcus antarcticus DSM 14505 TaxID=1185653 RepID=A0ABN4RFB9_9BACL|nr:hypothetical protein [Planococcus antarcticus]ANU10724.1 hypothetical protein BBH88_10595 [Planococcus antarcticus DSM 14505]
MTQSKWVKLGAAAFLSVGMLSACGDSEDEQPVDEDIDVTPEEGEEEIIPDEEPKEGEED